MWRFLSESLDDVVLGLNAVFRVRALRGSAGGPPPTLEALVAEQEASPPEIRWPGAFERRVGRIRLRLPVSGADTFADFHPAARPDADTLFVYHHGLSEIPHDGSAAGILGRGRLRDRVDWFAIKGAHHETRADVSEKLLFSEETFARGLLSSAFVAREIARRMRGRYRHIIMGGMSMGGVISLLESAVGSAFDLTLPLMAGPDLEAVLLRSSFSQIVCRRYRARAEEGRFSGALDLANRLASRAGPPIRAVLSTYDRLFHYGPQQTAYARVPRAAVTTISGGHITGALQFAALSAIVEATLERELWQPKAAIVRPTARPEDALLCASGTSETARRAVA